MKFHTCSPSLSNVMEKSKLKGHGFGFLEKRAQIVLKFVSPNYQEISQLILCIWVRIESCHLQYSQLLRINCEFYWTLQHQFLDLWKTHPNITLVLHYMRSLLKLTEIGLSTLSARWTRHVLRFVCYMYDMNIDTFLTNEHEEPAVNYKWTGWVWEITSWSSRLQDNYRSF